LPVTDTNIFALLKQLLKDITSLQQRTIQQIPYVGKYLLFETKQNREEQLSQGYMPVIKTSLQLVIKSYQRQIALNINSSRSEDVRIELAQRKTFNSNCSEVVTK